jgi:hypothetical protein
MEIAVDGETQGARLRVRESGKRNERDALVVGRIADDVDDEVDVADDGVQNG